MLDDVEDFTNMDMVSLGCVRIITDSDSTVWSFHTTNKTAIPSAT